MDLGNNSPFHDSVFAIKCGREDMVYTENASRFLAITNATVFKLSIYVIDSDNQDGKPHTNPNLLLYTHG